MTTTTIGGAGEPNEGIAHLSQIVDALLALLGEETRLVQAGALAEAGRLQPEKSALMGRYLAEAQRLKAGKLPPQAAGQAELRARHERLRALMRTNLAVLATAHAVAEGLVRGAAAEMARKRTPQTYGAGGRPPRPPVGTAQPVMLNRSL